MITLETWRDPAPAKISYEQWNELFKLIPQSIKDAYNYLEGTKQSTPYLNDPRCFAEEEHDLRLRTLSYDNSLASIRLWSFLLSEEERLHKARRAGKKIVGCMKDLGTSTVLAYAAKDIVAFYPDGAWWIPCIMEMSEGLLRFADSQGFGDEVCPSRAALSAFINGNHFPRPDLLIAAVGCCCDDFSAIMQRVYDLGIKTYWWELPFRRSARESDIFELLPNGERVTKELVDFVEGQFREMKVALEETVGYKITDEMVAESIAKANKLRAVLGRIRDLSYGSIPAPFPALETQICEMLSIHFCSDQQESINVLDHVLETIEKRVAKHQGVLPKDSCRVVWVNPVADLRAMNLFEDLGGALAGTEYLFRHALLPIRTDVAPLRALAMSALSDPMVGPTSGRARVVIDDAIKYNAEGVIVSNIPGASHCAYEAKVIREEVAEKLGIPVLEITVPPLSDANFSQIKTRLEAFFEVIRERRTRQ